MKYRIYIGIVCIGLVLSGVIQWKYRADTNTALEHYRFEAHEQSKAVADRLEDSFQEMYQGLRTMARLPGVQMIDRHAKHFDANARGAVQEIYNNLGSNVAMSEVYIVPVDLDPDKMDTVTQKLQIPITTFDHLILNRNADKKEEEESGVEEIEIYEYRQEKQQLAWLKAKCPLESGIAGLKYPAICGSEIITCDNSRYSPSHPNDKDRSGLVYSVPFYAPDGRLKGSITGIILTHALRDLLPSGNYAFYNTTQGYVAPPNAPGVWNASAKWTAQNRINPELLYCETLRLSITDNTGKWTLWAGSPNSAFYGRGDVRAARQFAGFAHLGVVLLILSLCSVARLVQHIVKRQAELEVVHTIIEQSDAALRKANSVLENAVEGISQLDGEGLYFTLNAAYAAILGYAPEEMIGMSWNVTVYPPDHAKVAATFETALAKGKADVEVQGIRKDGSLFHKQLTLITACDDAGKSIGNHCFMKDISERKTLEAKVSHQAFHDALTGLPNRLLFQDRLGSAIKRMARLQTGVAVLFVDLDNFKVVNDSLGHEAGDILLKTIAQRLEASARNGDTIARLGGDEFTLLLENIHNVEDAAHTAERIITQLQQPIALGTRELFASASIGVAFSNEDGLEAEDLLRDADTAMYQAKTQGKSGFVVFNTTMNADVVERMEIETGLRSAVERDELRVHYQPLIDLETGNMAGVEALVRWEHPTRGLMPPGKFIPIAEETGLILPIGYWVLEEACRQMQEWKVQYPAYGAFTMNVNLSGKQLQRPDVVEKVRSILEKTRVAPGNVKLEITESVMMADVDDTVAKLHQLKALGVKLAMDDFGTGYSSMASLNLFPLDTVKIDRAFIKRLAEHRESESIVAAIIMLSRALNLDVTGEGVETVEQLTHLQGLGCHIGQGYFFAKPLSADALGEGMAAGPQHFSPTIQPTEQERIDREMIEQYLRAA